LNFIVTGTLIIFVLLVDKLFMRKAVHYIEAFFATF
jgi:hypothetical protein